MPERETNIPPDADDDFYDNQLSQTGGYDTENVPRYHKASEKLSKNRREATEAGYEYLEDKPHLLQDARENGKKVLVWVKDHGTYVVIGTVAGISAGYGFIKLRDYYKKKKQE